MLIKFSKIFSILLVVALFGTLVTSAFAAEENIVEIAASNEDFTTLVTALDAAGLVETLEGEGPFTVFAPTDEAFANLPEGTLESLLNDIPALQSVLLYHVVPGNVMAADVVQLESADTALGEPVSIRVEDGMVYVNEAQVVVTDIEASNGVIHVIDAVIVPPAEDEAMMAEAAPAQQTMDIVETAVANGNFNTLATALTEAGLVETLQGEGPFTVFAPTDDAFAALPEGTLESLLNDIPALTDILLYHVVAGEVMAEDVVQLDSADTVLGEQVSITVEDGNVYVNEAQVIITDVEASNGVIHVIDAVLIPPADAPAALPETGGVNTTNAMLPIVLALGLILFAGGFGVLRTVRATNN
jgi:uncharacterized surface protein with fasciclin (FAS1) repeats